MDFIGKYLDYVKPYGGSQRFHKWCALSAISAALGRKCWVDRGAIKNLYPNLFIVLVAQPGIAKKSTTAGIAISLTDRMEKGAVKFTANKSSPAQLITDQKDCARTFIWNNKKRTHNSVFAWGNELTTLLADIGGGSVMFDLLEFYDADDRPFVKKIKKEGTIIIERPCMSLLACTTPAALHSDVVQHAAGTGLVSRTIFAVERGSVWVPPHPPTTTPKLLEQRDELVRELNRMSHIIGPFGWTKGGAKAFEEFHDQSQVELMKYTTILANYYARRSDHCVKLSMIFSACDSNSRVIDEQHVAKAVEYLEDVERDLIWAFGVKAIYRDPDLLTKVLDRLRDDQPISQNDLMAGFINEGQGMVMNQDYNAAINTLVVSGLVETWVDKETRKTMLKKVK